MSVEIYSGSVFRAVNQYGQFLDGEADRGLAAVGGTGHHNAGRLTPSGPRLQTPLGAFRFLVQTTVYTETVLAQFATHSAMETGRTFEQCFPSVVAYVYKLVREAP